MDPLYRIYGCLGVPVPLVDVLITFDLVRPSWQFTRIGVSKIKPMDVRTNTPKKHNVLPKPYESRGPKLSLFIKHLYADNDSWFSLSQTSPPTKLWKCDFVLTISFSNNGFLVALIKLQHLLKYFENWKLPWIWKVLFWKKYEEVIFQCK